MACEDLKKRLDDANAAYDRLVAGAQVVVIVDAFRSRVEYKPADLNLLTQQIVLLQVQYDKCLNPGRRAAPVTTPIQFVF